jgi:hypothetical protein
MDDNSGTAGVEAFVARWAASGAAERANYQLFLSELCELLGLPHPEPATPDTARNAYVFERAVFRVLPHRRLVYPVPRAG